jgi:lysophospholipase L1-like esterase
MDNVQETLPLDLNASSQGHLVSVFWGTTLVLALASALSLLGVSLYSGGIGGAIKTYCILAAVYAAAVGSCLWSRTWRGWLVRNTSGLLFLAGSSLFSVLVLELAVRFLSPPSPFDPSLPLRPRYRMKMDVDLPGVSPTGNYTTNSWGLRGDEPPRDWHGSTTVVTIGGSTTHCFFLDDKKTWPYLLQEELKKKHPKVWVGNGGQDGHSTRGHVIFMREVITKIKPDAVILLVGINDFSLSLNERFRLHGNGHDFDPNFARDPTIDPVRRLLRRVLHHSRIFQIMTVWKQVLGEEVTAVKMHGQGCFEAVPLSEPPPPLPADLKSLLPQLDEFRANVRQIIAIGRANDVRVIFLTQPLRYEDTEYYRGLAPRYIWMKKAGDSQTAGPHWSAAQHWCLLQEYNKNLLEVCRAEHVECYDLASVVPHSGTYIYDYAHFTEAGAELVAREVASFLESSDVPWDK